MPLAIGAGQRPTGHQVMDVRVILQLPAPGVQHPEEAGQLAADEARVGGEFADRSGGGFEQPLIAQALMRAQERAQGLGHGEGEHEVMPGHLAPLLALQPGLRLGVLATWTVSVAAAAGHHMGLAAGLAVIQRAAGRRGATALDGANHLVVVSRHRFGKAREVVRAVITEQLLERAHSQIPHQLVDQRIGILLPFAGQMQVDHGGLETGMAHVLLDHPQVHPLLEQMRGVGMAPIPISE